jgi:hypothetical protein
VCPFFGVAMPVVTNTRRDLGNQKGVAVLPLVYSCEILAELRLWPR